LLFLHQNLFLDTFSFFVSSYALNKQNYGRASEDRLSLRQNFAPTQNFAVGSQALFGRGSALPRPWDFLSVVAAKRTNSYYEVAEKVIKIIPATSDYRDYGRLQ